jgi:NADPH-dependent 2,4-dienoyl-CoA reductase/sulfur reductase-like enzyme
MARRLVVIGGNAAGMSAASQARRRLGRDDLEIVVFERGHFTSYSSCGIPYWVGGLVEGPDRLVARTPETFRDEYAMDVRLRHEVVAIDLAAREVVACDLEQGGRVRERFDELVYAPGARPIRPDWADGGLTGVFGVQTLDDGAALMDWLGADADADADAPPRRAVVVGAGYIGVEMAEALVRRGLEVTLVERSDEPMSSVDPDMGALVRKAICGLDIEVRTGVTVSALKETDGRVSAVVTDAGTLPADVVVLGLGVRPNADLARDAGLTVGRTGGVVTDLRMCAGDGVWAVGDCVETVHRVSGRPVYLPLGTHANKQGRVAGINIGGGYATFPGVVGTAVTKVCDLEVGRTGLLERDAAAAGYEFVTAVMTSTNRAGYFPGAAEMTVKLIAECRTGLLLGAQIVGRSEAAKRIDVLAAALWNQMTVEEMTVLDLGYAPPYAPVWDPVLVAARKAAVAVEEAGYRS